MQTAGAREVRGVDELRAAACCAVRAGTLHPLAVEEPADALLHAGREVDLGRVDPGGGHRDRGSICDGDRVGESFKFLAISLLFI